MAVISRVAVRVYVHSVTWLLETLHGTELSRWARQTISHSLSVKVGIVGACGTRSGNDTLRRAVVSRIAVYERTSIGGAHAEESGGTLETSALRIIWVV